LSKLPYRHIFFDLDRTLWDFDRNSSEAITEIGMELKLHDLGVTNMNEFIRVYQKVNNECWDLYRKGQLEKKELRVIRFRKALEIHNIHDPDLADEFGNRYVQKSPRKTNLIAGTFEALEALSGKGYELHIITNGFEEVQYIKLEECGIRKYFSEVIISELIGHKKPHPVVFNEAMVRAGAVSQESVMVGDDLEVDILGARDVGMGQIYYNPEELPHKEDITHEINHLEQILEIL
jgi:putative hydrolase of the HAD superfamily